MLIMIPPMRKPDPCGAGYFGAPRGERKHNGIDYACYPDTKVVSPVNGKVTKLGYAYKDKPHYRYVQVTDAMGYRHRIFYVQPYVQVGDLVSTRTEIGHAQDQSIRYPEITNHVHYEIKDKMGCYINPEIHNDSEELE